MLNYLSTMMLQISLLSNWRSNASKLEASATEAPRPITIAAATSIYGELFAPLAPFAKRKQ